MSNLTDRLGRLERRAAASRTGRRRIVTVPFATLADPDRRAALLADAPPGVGMIAPATLPPEEWEAMATRQQAESAARADSGAANAEYPNP